MRSAMSVKKAEKRKEVCLRATREGGNGDSVAARSLAARVGAGNMKLSAKLKTPTPIRAGYISGEDGVGYFL